MNQPSPAWRADSAGIIKYCLALCTAVALAAFVGIFTNATPPMWDGQSYVDMARVGIADNPNLQAPFAYRPAVPLLAGEVSKRLSITVEESFRLIGRIAAVLFSLSVFALSQRFARRPADAFVVVVLVGLLYQHIKYPLFFYTLIDVAAFPLIILAFLLLVSRRLPAALAVSSVGILFKEFLAIPLLLVILQYADAWWRDRSAGTFLKAVLAAIVGAAAVVLPRALIQVSSTAQWLDPFNDIGTLEQLYRMPADPLRWVNILYNECGYWLPTLLLLTRERLTAVWQDLEALNLKAIFAGFFALNFVLTMFGGTNTFIFASYAVPLQVVILTLLLRYDVPRTEIVFAVAALLLFNRIFWPIPLPVPLQPDIAKLEPFLDFYAGWESRVTVSTLTRTVEMIALLAGAFMLRRWRRA